MAAHGYEPEKLMKSIWQGTAAMIQNDGTRSNEAVFWTVFAGLYGEEALKDKGEIDGFYTEEFHLARDTCGFAPEANEIIQALKKAGKRLILATNPIFPAPGTRSRMSWAGLSPEDFELITTYENSSFCKPNPAYYTQIMEKQNLKPEECLMVGNDVGEDMVSETLGMKVFLLTDCLINRKNEDISRYPNGGFHALAEFLKTI